MQHGWTETRAGRHRPKFVVLAVICASMLGQSVAAEGIPVGKWLFYPSVEAIWLDESNLLLQEDDHVPASSYSLRPQLRWDLPFRDSNVSLEYTHQLRRFLNREADTGLEDKYSSNQLHFDTKLVFANRLEVRVEDEFIIDTLDTFNFDPGGEVPFNSTEYRRNRAGVQVLKPLGPRHGAGLEANLESLKFDDEAGAPFGDHDRVEAGLVYSYSLSPLSKLGARALFGSGEQGRPPVPGEEPRENFSTRAGVVFLQTPFGRHGLAEFALGYVRWDYRDTTQSDFRGLTGELRYQLHFSERIRVTTKLSRYPRQSFFTDNSYYINNNFEVRLQHEVGSHLFYTLTSAYRQNKYPEPVGGLRRDDLLERVEGGVGWRFNELLVAEARYRYDIRKSNFAGLDYDARRFFALLSFGWKK